MGPTALFVKQDWLIVAQQDFKAFGRPNTGFVDAHLHRSLGLCIQEFRPLNLLFTKLSGTDGTQSHHWYEAHGVDSALDSTLE